jgi:hypothetical protein
VTRDSAEFSAALLLGALGGAAVALALQSSDLNPRRRRARRGSLASLGSAFAGALREQVEDVSGSLPSTVAGAVSAARSGKAAIGLGGKRGPAEPLDRLRQAARRLGRLRESGAGTGR